MTTKLKCLGWRICREDTCRPPRWQPEVSVSTETTAALTDAIKAKKGGGLFSQSLVNGLPGSPKFYRGYVLFFWLFYVNLHLPSSWRVSPELWTGWESILTTELRPSWALSLPEPALSSELSGLTLLIPVTTLWDKLCYYPQFTDGNSGAARLLPMSQAVQLRGALPGLRVSRVHTLTHCSMPPGLA